MNRLTDFILSIFVVVGSLQQILADNNDQCIAWAENGECENNPGYMLKHCADACQRLSEVVSEQQARVRSIDSFYDLKANDIDGNEIDFEQFREKVVVITNVASQCGYTESHYASLVELYASVSHDEVHILAFPCNQFGGQEPGNASEIKEFAKMKGVEFTMMEKIHVNGPNTSLVYLFLKEEAGGPKKITWNFATYFVVDVDGIVESHSGVEPMDLQKEIFEILGKDEL